MGLWVLALSHCVDNRTDGVIDRVDVESLLSHARVRYVSRASRDLPACLVEAGLWEETREGQWRFHDWHDCQPLASQLAERTAKASAAARARWSRDECKPHASSTASSNAIRMPRARDPVPVPVPVPDQKRAADDGNRPRPAAHAAKTDLPEAELTRLEQQALAAIRGDESLAPICPLPAQLARDLVAAGPAVAVAHEVRKAGAWLRANPSKRKKNGSKFLLNWITRTQERGGSRGYAANDRNGGITMAPDDELDAGAEWDAHVARTEREHEERLRRAREAAR